MKLNLGLVKALNKQYNEWMLIIMSTQLTALDDDMMPRMMIQVVVKDTM